jgi:hypothetical protein
VEAKGFVIGLMVPGKDDHLTIGNDGDELAGVRHYIVANPRMNLERVHGICEEAGQMKSPFSVT